MIFVGWTHFSPFVLALLLHEIKQKILTLYEKTYQYKLLLHKPILYFSSSMTVAMCY
jgi:hypothetical protein